MVTKDLKIDDYVIRNGNILKITSLAASNVNTSIAVSGCTAIPLSNDLLQNQGFTLKTNGVLRNDKISVLSLFPTDVAGSYQWVLSDNVKPVISTFHQLQNIFYEVFGFALAVDEEKLRDSAIGHDLPAPTGVTASAVLAATATLTWTAVANAAVYKITDDDGVTMGDLIEAVTVDLTGLTAETEYSYKVQAIAGEGSIYRDSYLSAACEFETEAVEVLGTPADVVASDITTTTASVDWTAVADADGYAYSLDGGTNWEATTLTTNTVDLTGLTINTLYSFVVKALADDSGNFSDSLASTAVPIQTLAA